jgi:hypothetical protein
MFGWFFWGIYTKYHKYNDKLQIKFTVRSGPMIFDRVMALGFWNLVKYLVVTTFFRYAWRYWLDFWYMWNKVVTTKYLAKFQSPRAITRAITRPKIIRPEQNVNLICNSSLYTHIPKIKSISPSRMWKISTFLCPCPCH